MCEHLVYMDPVSFRAFLSPELQKRGPRKRSGSVLETNFWRYDRITQHVKKRREGEIIKLFKDLVLFKILHFFLAQPFIPLDWSVSYFQPKNSYCKIYFTVNFY